MIEHNLTAADVHNRVDRWLAARESEGWFADRLDRQPTRYALRRQWETVAGSHGADSEAARGVLLGLIREWHDDPGMGCSQFVDGDDSVKWQVCHSETARRWSGWPLSFGESEVDVLIAALEMNP